MAKSNKNRRPQASKGFALARIGGEVIAVEGHRANTRAKQEARAAKAARRAAAVTRHNSEQGW